MNAVAEKLREEAVDDPDAIPDEEEMEEEDDGSEAVLEEWDFVNDGGGAAKGLSPLEHFTWGSQCPHPGECEAEAIKNLPPDFAEVVQFEIDHTPEEIDEFRGEILDEMKRKVEELEPERKRWLEKVPRALQPLQSTFHGPFMNWLVDETGFKDEKIKDRMQYGFPLVGDMDLCWYNEVPMDTEKACNKYESFSVEAMVEQRATLNANVMRKVAETVWSGDLVAQMKEDANEGMMGGAFMLEE